MSCGPPPAFRQRVAIALVVKIDIQLTKVVTLCLVSREVPPLLCLRSSDKVFVM